MPVLVSDPMHHIFISIITFWDALNGPKPTKGSAWVRTKFCKVFFLWEGGKNTAADVAVNVASALGPEHMELSLCFARITSPAKRETCWLPLPSLYIEFPFSH